MLASKYRIVRRLGEGGMGVVYEAVHTRIEQRVAIKMLLPEVLDVPDVVSRFEREARAAGKLKSDNTTRVLDVDVAESGLPYMVMEFLDGRDLGKILEHDGALPVTDAVDFVLQACNAMAEAHAAGIVHRDLKPSNLFVTGAGAARKLKVLDFGISKVENDKDARVTATKAVVGTPLYMSPEQVRSAKHVDARSDIWSLGIILYELLTGRTPFEGSTTAAAAAICIDAPPPMASFRAGLPPALEEAVLLALQKDPGARFQSVHALAVAIAPFGSGGVQLSVMSPRVPLRTSSADVDAVQRARTVHASDPTLRVDEPPARSANTLPGWTTRSSPHTRRVRWVVALVVGALGTATVVLAASLLARKTSPAIATTTEAVPPSVTPGPPASVSAVEHVASVAMSSPLPPAPASTKPPVQGALTTGHPRAPLTTSVGTETPAPPTAHTAAPIPTRL